MIDKHYKDEGYLTYYSSAKVTHIVSLRLSSIDLQVLNDLYPGKNLSYQIRSAIHDAKRLKTSECIKK